MRIEPDEFRVFAQYIRSLCGVVLDDSKQYLVETRLSNLAQENGCSTFSELYFKARSDFSKNLPRQIIDAITTNETLFFRDAAPFEMLQYKILPELIDLRKKKAFSGAPIPLRVWSAACSTGQEVYSIAIVLKEMLGDLSRYDLRILGTDISNRAVAQASRGIYNKTEIERGLPNTKLDRYFTPVANGWKVKDEIRAMATFSTLNLLENFAHLGKFDIIFCRNVAIYFADQDKSALYQRLASSLELDGYLVIGATESLMGISTLFTPQRHLRSIYYQRSNGTSQPGKIAP
jgi:chemotaxis protein methyltransferase CheR